VTEKIHPPWTPDQVATLTRFQYSGCSRPFTCPHEDRPILLKATRYGWKCPVNGCTYTQDWAHDFMVNPDTWNIRRFTARPVSAEEERTATGRAAQAAADSERSNAWFESQRTDEAAAYRAQLRIEQERIKRARALHQPIAGEGGPYCDTCTQEEEQPKPTGWWVPFPCPTVQALTGPVKETT
jgi:hypothetical protein